MSSQARRASLFATHFPIQFTTAFIVSRVSVVLPLRLIFTLTFAEARRFCYGYTRSVCCGTNAILPVIVTDRREHVRRKESKSLHFPFVFIVLCDRVFILPAHTQPQHGNEKVFCVNGAPRDVRQFFKAEHVKLTRVARKPTFRVYYQQQHGTRRCRISRSPNAFLIKKLNIEKKQCMVRARVLAQRYRKVQRTQRLLNYGVMISTVCERLPLPAAGAPSLRSPPSLGS